MNLSAFKSYIETHVATLEASVAAEFHKFHDWVVGEEAKVKAEVQHLESLGWHVQPPQPDAPQAPDAPAAS